ncbi:aldo/keto reductase [Amphibacillus indicireducens]|uniref:Aldo/keto reductase n=1 Tax=Amphibacillus indicireducens TaxID=1076330 RepID=A0ABP7V1C7_9BACI
MSHLANPSRYQEMIYRRLGHSGLKVPVISLGLYRNFGESSRFDQAAETILTAFDLGITHFDLANNYGEPNGSAEEFFGQVLRHDLAGYRDELLISTKSGYNMWPGPYGEWLSRKHLIASLDQSLCRLGLDYVDIYYAHRYDPKTPIEETAYALDQVVKQGKALYVGVSNFPAEAIKEIDSFFDALGTPFVGNQLNYSMFLRQPEVDVFPVLEKLIKGAVVYQPLYQGLLTEKYLNDIPGDSRMAQNVDSLSRDQLTQERIKKVQQLARIAKERDQTMAQLAIAWTLRQKSVGSSLIGVSSKQQLIENIASIQNLTFTKDEMDQIELILSN